MSVLSRSRFALRSVAAAHSAQRLSVAIAPRYISRSMSSTMHDNDPELLEKEKRRNLNNEQHKTSTPFKNAPGWNESLASSSEAHVKADRSPSNPSELQAETVAYIHRRHSSDDGSSPTQASYSKEEVDGPLGSNSKDQVNGPLGTASSDTDKIVDKTVHETTRIHKHNPAATASEETVKADREEV